MRRTTIINNFDWKTYIENYDDLKKAGIDNAQKAYTHWIFYGSREGRIWQKKLPPMEQEKCHTNNIKKMDLNIIYHVGETCKQNMNTGIQRVTRLLCKYLKNKCNIQLTKFDYQTKQFVKLSDEDLENIQKYSGITIEDSELDLTLPNKWLIMPELILRPLEQSIQPIFYEARRQNMKIASIFHDDIPFKLHFFYPPEVLDYFMIYLNSLLTSDLILPNSNYSKKRLLTHCQKLNQNIHDKIITCLLPGEFPDVKRNNQYIHPVNHCNILCVSSIEPRKNQIPLIKAVESLQKKYKIKLTLVGVVNNASYYDEVTELIKFNKLIEYHRTVTDEILQNLYNEAHLTVYPSIEEGYGLPILESLWHCRPCICMNNDSTKDICSLGCLKINCSDSDEISIFIERFIIDETLRNRLVDEIKNIELKTWNKYSDEIISCIRSYEKNIYNVYNCNIPKRILKKYVIMHNKKDFLKIINKCCLNKTKLKVGFDTTPINHPSYANRGIGYLIKSYIDILSNIPYIDLIPLTKDNCHESFDIIHFTCPPLINDTQNNSIYEEIDLIRNECLKNKNSKVFIISIYDIIPHIFNSVYKPSKVYYDFMNMLNQMDLIIAISNSTKKDLIQEFKLPENKIYVIYPSSEKNVHHIIDKSDMDNTILSKYKIIKKYIIYVAGIDFRKNIDRTIQGFALAKTLYNIDAQLVIVCAINKTSKEFYSKFVCNLKLSENDVIFTDFVPDDELKVLYYKASVSIFSSMYEGFGMPIIESISNRIPTIVSNTSSMNELFELSSGGLSKIDPYSIESISNAIKYYLSMDTTQLNYHITKSYEILPLFSNEMVKNELQNAYKYAWNKKINNI